MLTTLQKDSQHFSEQVSSVTVLCDITVLCGRRGLKRRSKHTNRRERSYYAPACLSDSSCSAHGESCSVLTWLVPPRLPAHVQDLQLIQLLQLHEDLQTISGLVFWLRASRRWALRFARFHPAIHTSAQVSAMSTKYVYTLCSEFILVIRATASAQLVYFCRQPTADRRRPRIILAISEPKLQPQRLKASIRMINARLWPLEAFRSSGHSPTTIFQT